ncbi:transcriptional regulator AraC/XylS family protein [Acinetobacter nosocomialis]|nr:transcriptional regulator AraC/XylS family protein [Acinetobacter nosocomialis]
MQAFISDHLSTELTAEFIAAQLFMSSSTLRRKLKNEGNSIQDIRNRVRLGHGLHLLQTTNDSIGNIAFECGYQSQSRFTEQFKNLFGITPRELRKTKMLN